MKNNNNINKPSLKSDNLKQEINNFKSKFLNKSEYFICEQDIVGLVMNKYLDILQKFFFNNFKKLKNNFLVKIYKLIVKRSNQTNRLLSKFESLEQKIDSQQLIIERSFNLNSKLQKEVDYINNEIINNFSKFQTNLNDNKNGVIGHNSNTKVDFYQEENLRLGSELVETKKKFEILKSEIEKYENQRSDLISKINSVNEVINDSNVLTNVFENKIEPKINIIDPQNIQKKSEPDLNEQVKAIFSKKI
tara:strand:- start:818 stop:1561 length:744 start_codon:yes stop_codon:yes gene_type:complete